MATLTIKNVPRELYKQLKKRAAEHRRSMNSEVIVCLEEQILTPIAPRNNVDQILEEARRLRRFTAGHRLTGEEIKAAINEGRP